LRMPALSLLYIVGKLAEKKIERALAEGEVVVELEELFETLHDLWVRRGIALCSDFNLVLDQLKLLEAAGYLKVRRDEGKGLVLGIGVETLSELEKVIPEYVKKHLPIV